MSPPTPQYLGGSDTYVEFEFRKVHSFLSATPRLMDLRGRNASLVIGRKLLASIVPCLVYSSGLGEGCGVLRYGGNLVRVGFRRGLGSGGSWGRFRDVLGLLLGLYNHIFSPSSMLARVYLADSSRGPPTPHGVDFDLQAGVSSTIYVGSSQFSSSSTEFCDVCGMRDLVVDLENPGVRDASRYLLHVARDERRLCARDLFFRLLGRTLNSPGVIAVARLSSNGLSGQKAPNDPDFIACEWSLKRAGLSVSMYVKSYRHEPDPGRSIAPWIDDTTLIGLTATPDGKAKCGVEYMLIGLRPHGAGKTPLDRIAESIRELSEINCLDGKNIELCVEALEKRYREVLAKDLKEVIQSADRFSAQSPQSSQGSHGGSGGSGMAERIRFLLNDLSTMLQRSDCCTIDVFPPIGSAVSRDLYLDAHCFIDLEYTLVNLYAPRDGGVAAGILDLDAVAAVSDSGKVVYVRGDGDRFGVLTDPSRIEQELKLPCQGSGPSASEWFRKVELDSVVERYIVRYLRNTPVLLSILYRDGGPLPRALVIYVGGDENLFILASSGDDPSIRIHGVWRFIGSFRDLLLEVSSRALTAFYGDIGDLKRLLEERKIATLTSAAVSSSPKFPSYIATGLLDQIVDLGKEISRDSLAFYNLDSVDMEWVDELWREEPILLLTPYRPDLMRRAYRKYIDNQGDISGMFLTVLDYCVRSGRGFRECMDVYSGIFREVLSNLLRFRDNLDQLRIHVDSLALPRSGYVVVELAKHLERGFG